MKGFFKQLWYYTGVWANPHRVMYYESMLREAKWKLYVNEIKLLTTEAIDMEQVHTYCEHVLKTMEELK